MKVADGLLNGRTEADWRSAVSRAYYSAFHVARELLAGLGFRVPKADRAHAYLWRRLANAGGLEVERMGNELSSLRTQRNQADYELKGSFSHLLSQSFVQSAKDIVKVLDRIKSEPMRSEVIAAICDFETRILKEDTHQP